MRPRTLILRYGAFAAIATTANLSAQKFVLATIDVEFRLVLAMLVGTGVGLVAKYILDKRWIFFDTSRGIASQGKNFALYSATGVVTTLIFWATETAFWLAWQTDLMLLVGAAIGLLIGYLVKYKLDRRFVFTSSMAKQAD